MKLARQEHIYSLCQIENLSQHLSCVLTRFGKAHDRIDDISAHDPMHAAHTERSKKNG